MAKKEDDDIRDVMAAETSRGRRRPQTTQSREEQRLLRRIASLILDRNCDLSDYINVLREDFGLAEQSEKMKLYVNLWKKHRRF